MLMALKQLWGPLIFFVHIKNHFQMSWENQKKLFKASSAKVGLVMIQWKKYGICIHNQKFETNFRPRLKKTKTWEANWSVIDQKLKNCKVQLWVSKANWTITKRLKKIWEDKGRRILNSIHKYWNIWVK